MYYFTALKIKIISFYFLFSKRECNQRLSQAKGLMMQLFEELLSVSTLPHDVLHVFRGIPWPGNYLYYLDITLYASWSLGLNSLLIIILPITYLKRTRQSRLYLNNQHKLRVMRYFCQSSNSEAYGLVDGHHKKIQLES